MKQILNQIWTRIKNRRTLPFFVLALGVFGFVLLVSTRPQTRPADINERVWAVSSKVATYGVYTPQVSAFGALRARREVDLRAQVSGEVITTSPNFEEGAYVQAGEVLVEIDPFDYRAALDEAQAQLAGGRAMLVEAQASAQQARLDLTRTQSLAQRGTLSQKTLDDAQTTLTIRKARRDQQKALLARYKVQVARAQRNLQDTKLTAPFSGHLGDIAARTGRVLAPNERVANLSDAHAYDVRFNLSDADYGRFLSRNSDIIGRKIDIFWDIGGSQVQLRGVIERVGAQISQATRGVDIFARIETKNKDQEAMPNILRSGAFVSVVLTGQPINDVVSIPKQAVYGDNLIYLIEKGRLVPFYLKDPLDVGTAFLVRSGTISDGKNILLTRFNEAAAGVAVLIAAPPTLAQTPKQ
ncbi:MAG: efflux RND transporter periplasmic adaptor subunit [Alphaproteobacteria bacterium]|nr:efflux RND transporter periplasmic adaptor subunit [Alphaproteobacteria bacterium]